MTDILAVPVNSFNEMKHEQDFLATGENPVLISLLLWLSQQLLEELAVSAAPAPKQAGNGGG